MMAAFKASLTGHNRGSDARRRKRLLLKNDDPQGTVRFRFRNENAVFSTIEPMTLRMAKMLLVFAVAGFYSLVVLNNTTDYNSNYQFTRHVLMMDSTRPDNAGMWRALNSPVWHASFFVSIILWETITMILSWWGGVNLARALRGTAESFNQAKRAAIVALTSAILMWLVAFLSIGGEWFLMWQSKTWNGQDAAFRMFAVIGIVLLFLAQPETDGQP